MRRRLFSIASAVSLLLCVAMVALWVRSYFVSDRIAYNTADLITFRCKESRLRIGRGLVLGQSALRTFSTSEAVEMFIHDLPHMDHETIGFSLRLRRLTTSSSATGHRRSQMAARVCTGGALFSDVTKPGPIYLQAITRESSIGTS